MIGNVTMWRSVPLLLLGVAAMLGQQYGGTVVAGVPVTGNEIPALSPIGTPTEVAVGPTGIVYFREDHRIRELTPSGTIKTVHFACPLSKGLAAGAQGVYFACEGRVFRVDVAGKLELVAGRNLQAGSPCNTSGIPALRAVFCSISDLTLDYSGALIIAERSVVWRVGPDGILRRAAGTGKQGSPRVINNQPALETDLCSQKIAVDQIGGLFISCDKFIYRVFTGGLVTTVAGGDRPGVLRDGAIAAEVPLSGVTWIDVNRSNVLHFGDRSYHGAFAVGADGKLKLVAGTGELGFAGDGGAADSARFSHPADGAAAPDGSLILADAGNARIRKVTPEGKVETIIGAERFTGDGGAARQALLHAPTYIALDPTGNLLISDTANYRIRKVTPEGIISTIAGTGVSGFSGDGRPAVSARLNSPGPIVADKSGSIFFADGLRIREITLNGTIQTYVNESGREGLPSEGVSAQSAWLEEIKGLAIDSQDNLLFGQPRRVWQVSRATKTLAVVAGDGLPGLADDGEPARSASFSQIQGIAVDGTGSVYIADWNSIYVVARNGVIRKVQTQTTYYPSGVAVDSNGNVYYTSRSNGVLGQVTNGSLRTLMGSRDGLPLSSPGGLAISTNGDIYVSDVGNQIVLKVAKTVTRISSIANGASFAVAPVVAPDAWHVINGEGLASNSVVADGDSLPTKLDDVWLSLRDSGGQVRTLQLKYVSPKQVNFYVPAGVPQGQATLFLFQDSGIRLSYPVTVFPVVPGMFSANGDGRGVLLGFLSRARPDGSLIQDTTFDCSAGAGKCAVKLMGIAEDEEAYLTFFGTGFRNARNVAVAVNISFQLPVHYAGPQGVFPGIDQINVQIPKELFRKYYGPFSLRLVADGVPGGTLQIGFDPTAVGR